MCKARNEDRVCDKQLVALLLVSLISGLYRENAITIESEARYTNGGNAYYVRMQICA